MDTRSHKKIIHCDADCFFAALEMRDDSSLRGIPMAVGGDPNRRGVISTCNYEARAFGVRSALASAYAKRLCPQLIILPHNMTKYKEAAAQLREIFLSYTDKVEPLSLDEAFLDVSDTDIFRGSATLIANDIRRRVEKEIGITVSAGIAANKFLAKVASDWEKPDGLTVIEPQRMKFFLSQLPIRCIPGVGARTEEKLKTMGVYTCSDLLPYSHTDLCQFFGKFGDRLYHFSRGEDHREVKVSRERKSMSVEHTLSQDLPANQCQPFLSDIYQKLLTRLEQASTYKVVKLFIKIKFMDFSRTTMEMSGSEANLMDYQTLFDKAWERYKKPVRLLGMGVRFADSGSPTSTAKQLDLFL